MDLVKVISSELDSTKKRIVKFLRLGKSDVRTSVEVGPFGIDSSPVKDMIAIYSPTSINGKTVIIGYVNKNQLADVGEVRMYSTDSSGVQKFYTWLKNDGTFEIGGKTDNAVRYSKLETAFNQLKSDFNTFIAAYNLHTHAGVTAGSSVTAITAPGTVSSADISPAKINEIKTL